jgi:uncharacterized RDD family membrane protein YckC
MTDPSDRRADLQGQYAGFVSRLIATVVDIGIITAANVILAWAAIEALAYVGVDVRNCHDLGSKTPVAAVLCHGALVVAALVGTWGPVVYALFFWSTTGQTPGKAVMGVRVVRLDGKPMSVWTAVRRIAGYFLSLAAVGIGFLVILVDDRRRGWHDRIAGTCVIYSWKARQSTDRGGRSRGRSGSLDGATRDPL